MREQARDLRIPVMMSRAEVEAIDAWRRVQSTIPSRSEAIRLLIAQGLDVRQEDSPEFKPVVLQSGKRPGFDEPAGKK